MDPYLKTAGMRQTDRFGRPFVQKGMTGPGTAGRWPIRPSVNDRGSISNILSEVTPERIVSIFNDADAGYLGSQIELADDIMRDAHFASVMQTRTLAIHSLDWTISAGETTDGASNKAAAQDAADRFKVIWKALNKQKLFEILLKALSHQWAIAQVLWSLDQSKWTPIGFRTVDCRRLEWPMADTESDDPREILASDIPFLRSSKDNSIIPLTPGSFVIHTHKAEDGRPGHGAPIRAIAFWWMVKRLGSVDFSSFVEQFGRPRTVVKHDPTLSADQVRAILRAIIESASDLAVAIPANADAELVTLAASNESPHLKLITLADEQVSKAVIGSTTVSDAAGNNDSVSSPTHARVQRLIRNADAELLAATLNRDLVGPWAAWNLGPNVPAPKIEPVLAETPDPAQSGPVLATASNLRLAVMSQQVYDMLGLDRPEGVPDVIELQPAGGLSGFGLPGMVNDASNGGNQNQPDTTVAPPDGTDDDLTDANASTPAQQASSTTPQEGSSTTPKTKNGGAA